ncbi:YidC/Oxa1 family membrane protein insertase [Elusimicrobium posterum]|uniref:membrane protein insertase YidC n=1 Tax=Elusimicrobium posterum TaxID=3116653 RepID=UPI003C73EB39
MENRNFLIPVLILLIALLSYNEFIAGPKKAALLKAEQAEQLANQPQQTPSVVTSPAVSSNNTNTTTSIVNTAPTEQQEVFYDFSSANVKADIKFSSKGAGIKDFIFKDVVTDVNLTPYEGEGFFATFPSLDFKRIRENQESITFQAKAENIVIEKTYTFNENGINNLNLVIKNTSKKDVNLQDFYYYFGPGLGTVKSELNDNGREMRAVYTIQKADKKYPTIVNRTKQDADEAVQDGSWIWAGVQNRYFLAALIPQNWKSGLLESSKKVVDTKPNFFGLLGKSKVEGPILKVDVPAMILPALSTTELKSEFYFGPKDYKAFENMPYHLEKSIDFGFFHELGRIARSILDFIYKYTGNYGVAIIIFACLLQVLMLYFTIMQHKSSHVMKKIQPEMARIQKDYADDKVRQQQEMMALYKKYKFNPLSGCLPMLLQLPIFIALFNALRTSWDLHGAPFALWITDLSSKDPYYVLPIVMGGIMFVQQKFNTPVGGDPTQTAMLKWMPVIFTVLFINFPAGLVLYWLTNSILSFGIQLFVHKKLHQ